MYGYGAIILGFTPAEILDCLDGYISQSISSQLSLFHAT